MNPQPHEKYPHVFEPLKIGPVEVANRLYMPPHGIGVETPIPGQEAYRAPAEDFAAYYAERARGGVALLFHSTLVGPIARQAWPIQATPWFSEAVPAYRRVAEAVHEHGAKLMAEIWYANFMAHTWEPLGPEAPIVGPSVTGDWVVPRVAHAMSKDEIRKFVAMNARAARHLQEAGYDGVEIHASHGTLVEHFISPSFNRRADEYGGTMENRLRILCEILEAVREEVGSEMALGIRINADELLPSGYSADDARGMMEHLRATGLMDFVDLDVSVEPEQGHLMTTSFLEAKLHNVERVAAVSPAVRPLAVLAGPGRLTSVAEAESLLERGIVDMVGAVRGLIAEPALVKHARDGHEDRSRTCIAANHCVDAGMLSGFGCAINPEAGKEIRWGSHTYARAPKSMSVVVVGAGPAGLEAAHIAAERGHSVRLLEATDRIGGQIDLWARIPGREHIRTLIDWYERRLQALDVEPEFGVTANADTILADRPDVVIVATGGRYSRRGDSGFTRAEIAGWDRPFVHTPEAIIGGEVTLAGKVVVLDEEGLHAGVGVAEIAAGGGAEVHLVTRKPSPAAHVGVHLAYVLPRLVAAGVQMLPGNYVTAIGDNTVTLIELLTQRLHTIEQVDAVVLATMREPVNTLETLEGVIPHVYVVGDALAPRGLRESTYEGYRFARVIGEDDMPATVTEELWDRQMAPLTPAGQAAAVL
jgi:2,4-dienoyl-CoA reductase-like NADH-dependent reductase (Old Yellow Enzyme family)/thioredoxin reductase